jgi:hypothetical protein
MLPWRDDHPIRTQAAYSRLRISIPINGSRTAMGSTRHPLRLDVLKNLRRLLLSEMCSARKFWSETMPGLASCSNFMQYSGSRQGHWEWFSQMRLVCLHTAVLELDANIGSPWTGPNRYRQTLEKFTPDSPTWIRRVRLFYPLLLEKWGGDSSQSLPGGLNVS